MKSGEKKTLGGSVRGAGHVTQEKPCQDAMRLYESPGYVIACVADGHGSDRCPLSDKGAQAAVDIACELLGSILDAAKDEEDARKTLNMLKEIHLAKQLEAKWKTRVEEIHAGTEDTSEKEPFTYLLYGTTLLTLAAANGFVFVMQIGDGDMLMVDPDGEVERLFPAVEQTGSETYSLCMEQSWQHVQTKLFQMPGKKPLMFLLCTDGYANSFTEPAGFLKAGADIYALWQTNGPDYIRQNIEDWLTRSSEMGSGDDITLALVTIGDRAKAASET